MLPKIIRAIFILLFLLALFVAGAIVFLQTDYSRGIVKSLAERAVSRATGQTFTIGDIEWDLLSGIRLRGVSLSIDGKPFIKVGEASIRYLIFDVLDGSTLLGRFIPLRQVVVSGLEVTLRKDSYGAWNISELVREKKEKPTVQPKITAGGWGIAVKTFLVKDSIVTVDKEGDKREIKDIELDFSLEASDLTKKLEVEIKDGRGSLSHPEILVKGLNGKVAHTGHKTRVHGLKAEVNGSVVGLDGELTDFAQPKFNIEITTRNFNIAGATINGELAGSGVIKTPSDVDADFKVNLFNSVYMGRRFSGSIGTVRLRGKEVVVKDGEIRTEAGGITFSGSAMLGAILGEEDENTLRLNVNVADMDVNYVLGFNQPKAGGLDGRLNASFDIAGRWVDIRRPEYRVDIRALKAKGYRFGSFDLNGYLEGSASAVSFNVKSVLDKLDLGVLLGNERLSSTLNTSIELKGSTPLRGDEVLDKLSALANIDVYPSQIASIEVDQGVIRASYSGGVINVRDCLLKSGLFVIEVKGRGTASRKMDLTYKAQILDLGIVSRLYPKYSIQGALTAEGSIRGTLKNPAISLLVSGSDLSTGKDAYYVRALSLSGELGGNSTNPRLDLRGTLEGIRIFNKSLDRAEFEARNDGRAVLGSLSLTEKPDVRLETRFKVEDIVSEEKLIQVGDVGLAFKNALIVSRKPAYIKLSRGSYLLDGLNLYFSEASLLANLSLYPDGRIVTTVNLSGLDLEELSKAFGIAPAIHGVAGGTVRLSRTLENPEIGAELSVRALAFEEFRSDAARLSLGYRSGVFDIDLSVVEESREILSSRGTLNYDLNLRQAGKGIERATLNVAITSVGLELSPLAKASEEIMKINGLLLLNLRALGNLGSPMLEGTVQLKDVSIRLASLRNKLFMKEAQVEFDGNRGKLKALDVETEGGRGSFEGELDLANLSYSIEGKLYNFLVEPKYITARLDGRFGVEGSGRKLKINGKATVRKATVRIPEEPIKDVEDITFVDEYEEEFFVEEAKPSGYFRNNVALELVAKLEHNTWIKGRGANVEINGDLNINKPFEDELRLSGEIETVRGTYQIFGKVFRIERGTILFAGTKEINPSLDVHALYRAGGVKVFINVTGTAQRQVLNLASDPPMDDADIISYILFGTSTERIGAGARASIQQTAGKIAGGIAAKELNKLLGERLALDVLSIGGAGGETEVEVGKYITDKLYVSYERRPLEPYASTQPEFTNRLRVEYIITSYLTVESVTGGEDAGLDLFFYYRY